MSRFATQNPNCFSVGSASSLNLNMADLIEGLAIDVTPDPTSRHGDLIVTVTADVEDALGQHLRYVRRCPFFAGKDKHGRKSYWSMCARGESLMPEGRAAE